MPLLTVLAVWPKTIHLLHINGSIIWTRLPIRRFLVRTFQDLLMIVLQRRRRLRHPLLLGALSGVVVATLVHVAYSNRA